MKKSTSKKLALKINVVNDFNDLDTKNYDDDPVTVTVTVTQTDK